MSGPNRTILLVDDEVALREALSHLLEEEGYCVDQANNGAEALDYLRASPPPALILLDLMMPIMSGWEFRAAQQADPSLSEIPVVVLSASGGLLRQHEELNAQYLRKPIDVDRLLEVLDRATS